MSLKQSLVDLIKTHGRLTHREVVQYCLDHGYKPDNATRRMREAMNEDLTIETERHSGTIMAYVYKPSNLNAVKPKPRQIQEQPPKTDKNPVPTKNSHQKPNFNDSAIPPIYCCEINDYSPGNHSRGCKGGV